MAKLQNVRNVEDLSMFIGGRKRTFVLDMNAFAEIEKKYGSIEIGMTLLQDGKLKSAKKMLWFALIHDEVKEYDEDGEPLSYNMTPHEVGKWVTSIGMLPEVTDKLNKALIAGLPEQDIKELEKQTTDAVEITATVVYTNEEKEEIEKNV